MWHGSTGARSDEPPPAPLFMTSLFNDDVMAHFRRDLIARGQRSSCETILNITRRRGEHPSMYDP